MMSSAIRRSIAARTNVISRPAFAARQFSIASGRYARKDAMGKDDLKPEPNEYSKSASDDQAARVEKTAFDPNQTSPESQEASAGQEGAEKGKSNNPLDASPANHELSHVNDAKKGQPEGSPSESPGHEGGRARTSGGGGAPKSGGGKYGGGTSG
ncbi:hypothetical protein Tdes44962_MAKER08860 [Teratosphaeria destructans]|uniref:Uncharacterized protein n=1 Tax=Teratosphaeria destructans TaxID=418781 RepID=A0A9W7SV63_9PEZI|nr:hypothetical protein Tdes44962_MAKER08860 [Teratosphaeria destructans]